MVYFEMPDDDHLVCCAESNVIVIKLPSRFGPTLLENYIRSAHLMLIEKCYYYWI
jgi:hypothetical protein